MAGKEKKARGGGKLQRSETVSVRLDPKLRYLVELASRRQRRSASSFIEWAIAESLGSVDLDKSRQKYQPVAEVAEDLWSVEEADRLVKLALRFEYLLTHEEQIMWKLIRENGAFWRGDFNPVGEWVWEVEYSNVIVDRVRDFWGLIQSVAQGERPASEMPDWERVRDGNRLPTDRMVLENIESMPF